MNISKKPEFHPDKCYVDKRRLELAFEFDGVEYEFVYDDWNTIVDKQVLKLTIDGKGSNSFKLLSSGKYELQAVIYVKDKEGWHFGTMFIDRRYEHSKWFNVYFYGQTLTVIAMKEKI